MWAEPTKTQISKRKKEEKMASSEVTIKIEESTLQLLKALKEETGSKNFDDTIRKLSEMRLTKSLFGAHPEMSSFTEKDKIRFREL
jgi:hypothetical protein